MKEMFEQISNLYARAFTNVLCQDGALLDEKPEVGLLWIEKYEYYHKLKFTNLSSRSEFETVMKNAKLDYELYLRDRNLQIFTSLNGIEINLQQTYQKIIESLDTLNKKLLNFKKSANNQTATHARAALTIKVKSGKSPQFLATVAKPMDLVSENYTFGADVAKNWICTRLATYNGELTYHTLLPSLKNYLERQSNFTDYVQGGLDEYNRIMGPLLKN